MNDLRCWQMVGFVFVCTVVSETAFAQSRTASLVAHGKSVQLLPSTPIFVTGVGSVTSFFSTFNGATGPFLIQSGTGIVSGELRPRSTTPGLYEGGYAQATPLLAVDYGSYILSIPTTDSDGNGIPDLIQFDRDGNFTATGSGFSVSANLTFTITVRFNRSSGSAIGSYSATTQNSVGQTNTVNGVYDLLSYQGTVSYTRGATNTMSISATILSEPGTTLTGSTPYTISSVDQVSYPAFTIRSNAGTAYQVRAGTLSRSGSTYRGNFSLADGLPQTSWTDFTEYALAISDFNDSDRNGIPDFSDLTAAPPTITTQPRSVSVAAGQIATLSVIATGAISYQWTKNGTDVPGATTATLTFPAAQISDAGTYAVKAINSAGTTMSTAATLSIAAVPPPTISAQPRGTTLGIGATGALTVQAAGTNLTYQWLLDDTPIIGATGATYAIPNAQPSMSGGYKVRVSNAGAAVTSAAVPVSIAGEAIMTEEFSASSINSALWASAQAFSDSRTEFGNGSLTLRNRGRLLSKNPTPAKYSVSTRFRLSGSSFDQFALFLRTSGSVTNGSFDSGVSVEFQIRSGDQGTTGSNNIKISPKNTAAITGSFSIVVGTWYDAVVEDDGTTIIVRINSREVVRAQTNIRTGSLLGLQNREGSGGGSSISAGSITEVDYVRMTSSLINTLADPTPRLANISTRGFVGSGSNVMICGFVVRGSIAQGLLVRAAGPALTSLGVSGAVVDPQLTMRDGGALVITSNDNWTASDATIAQSVGAFPFTVGSKDAAVSPVLSPGTYTVEIAGTDGTTGTALVEAYDTNPAEQRVRIVNISTRGSVGTGSDSLIAGLVVAGTSPRRTLVRAIGPTLTGFGLPGALGDPVVAIYNASGVKLFENDDWQAQENASAIAAAAIKAGAFALPNGSKDAAMLIYLPPGAFTFVVTGKNASAGVALIEAYEVD
jgi:hypothetical protein